MTSLLGKVIVTLHILAMKQCEDIEMRLLRLLRFKQTETIEWSVRSPSTLAIRVRIPQKLTSIFYM